jgi:hypothetical protein
MIKTFKKGISRIFNSEKELIGLSQRTFEDVLNNYLVLLLFCALFAAFFEILYSLSFVLFFDFTRSLDISYFRFFNYAIGNAISIFFLYIFLGTFFVFFLSLILRIFVKNIKYIDLFKILLFSFTPVLLFSFIRFLFLGLLVWTFILFFNGILIIKKHKTSKKSLDFRD